MQSYNTLPVQLHWQNKVDKLIKCTIYSTFNSGVAIFILWPRGCIITPNKIMNLQVYKTIVFRSL